MLWFLFALLAALSWGIGQTLVKKGFEHTTSLFNNLLGTLFGVMIFIPFSLIGGVNWSLFPNLIPLVFLAAAPNLLFYYAIEKGEISLTGTLVATYPIFTVLLSRFFLGEHTDIFQKVAIMFIIYGAFLVSKPAKFYLKLESWVIWGIVSAIIIGFADFMGKVALTKSDIYSFEFAFAISYLLAGILNFLFDKKGRQLPKINKRKLFPTLSGTFLMEVGVLFLYLGFSTGQASLVSPISSSYVVLTIIFAFIFLNEKVSKTQLIGIIFTVLGIIAIGI